MQKTFIKFDKEFKLQISWITFKIAFFLTRVKAKLFDKNPATVALCDYSRLKFK